MAMDSEHQKTFKHLFMIPSNRLIDNCCEGYIREIKHAIINNYIFKKDIALVFVDDGDEDITHSNSVYLDKIVTQYHNDVFIFHLTPNMINEYLSKLCSGNIFLERIFTKKQTNFGRIGNILSLLASSFHANYIHRRDSDTLLHHRCNRISSPLCAELSLFSSCNDDYLMIGANYNNTVDIDTTLFIAHHPIIKSIYTMVGMNDEAISEKLRQKPYYFSDEIEYYRINNSLWPDMGNIAYKNIFKHIAFPPHTATLGTDYYFMQICESLNLPMFLHNQNVDHIHTSDRQSIDYYIHYYLMLARCIDYYSVYSLQPVLPHGTLLDNSSTISQLLHSLLLLLPSIYLERKNKLLTFADLFLNLSNNTGSCIHNSIQASVSIIIDDNDTALREHITLQEHWSSLVHRASLLSPDALLFSSVDTVA